MGRSIDDAPRRGPRWCPRCLGRGEVLHIRVRPDDHRVVRRRECTVCGFRWSTDERVMVVMNGRPQLYIGYRMPLWPERRRTTASESHVLYLTRGGRWRRLDFAPNLSHKHSPGGFNWGYGGSGPAELARHLLWHATGRRDLLERPDLYQEFKRDVLVDLGHDWVLDGDQIRSWVLGNDKGDPFAVVEQPFATNATVAR